MPSVKKAEGKAKKVNLKEMREMTESQAWKAIGDRCLHPMEMFKKASASTGSAHTQTISVLTAISATFLNELETKGTFFLPGFGTFIKKITKGQPGKMKAVFGKWKAIPPVPGKTEIIFVPFCQFVEYLAFSSPGPHRDVLHVDRPSSSAGAAGSAAPRTPTNLLRRPAAAHAPAPNVIAAPDKDDKDDESDVMGDDSSSSSEQDGELPKQSDAGPPPAAALGPC